jgi:hypothetical protein
MEIHVILKETHFKMKSESKPAFIVASWQHKHARTIVANNKSKKNKKQANKTVKLLTI